MNMAPEVKAAGPVRSPQVEQRLSYADAMRFSKLLFERCGLHFSQNRWSEFDSGVCKAFAASTCANLDEFYASLLDPQAQTVNMDLLINAVTVSETHFFRDAAQFNALHFQILPQLIERKRSLRSLRIWSAGCASGEEPYSIAMLLRELLPDVDQWAITILATDINTASLERARQGIYGSWAFREERAKQFQARYFQQNGHRFKLRQDVRNMVSFARLNLVDPVYPAYATNTMLIDLLICRNVTIYFNESVTRSVVDRFYECLTGGGWLVVGHSEPSLEIYRRFQPRNFPDTVLYQRISPAGSAPAFPLFVPPPMAAPLASDQPRIEACQPTLLSTNGESPGAKSDPLEKAQELLEFGHSEEAVILLLSLVKEKPDQPALCTLLGEAYANLGNWQEAEQWCRCAIQNDILNQKAYYTLALVLQHQGQLEKAIEAMKKVVYLDRTHLLGHYGLANLYYENSQLPQAQKSLDNALRLLAGKQDDKPVGADGITAGRLREAIVRQQQAWSAA